MFKQIIKTKIFRQTFIRFASVAGLILIFGLLIYFIDKAILGIPVLGFIGSFIIISLLILLINGVRYSYITTIKIQKLKERANRLLDYNFDSEETIENKDEIDSTSIILNDISKNLKHSFDVIDVKNKELADSIEKEKKLDDERRDFTAAASHELKTPIAILKGYLEGMQMNIGKFSDRDTYLKKSIEVTDEMSKLVLEMIDINRLSSREYLKISDVNLTDLVKEQVQRIGVLIQEKEQVLKTKIDENIIIHADKKLIERALNNILHNAQKYSPNKETVSVNLVKKQEIYILTVENTGITIPEIESENLFNQFTRVEKSHNKETGGSGIGLYVVKKVMELHNFEYQLFNGKNATKFQIKIDIKKNSKLEKIEE